MAKTKSKPKRRKYFYKVVQVYPDKTLRSVYDGTLWVPGKYNTAESEHYPYYVFKRLADAHHPAIEPSWWSLKAMGIQRYLPDYRRGFVYPREVWRCVAQGPVDHKLASSRKLTFKRVKLVSKAERYNLMF